MATDYTTQLSAVDSSSGVPLTCDIWVMTGWSLWYSAWHPGENSPTQIDTRTWTGGGMGYIGPQLQAPGGEENPWQTQGTPLSKTTPKYTQYVRSHVHQPGWALGYNYDTCQMEYGLNIKQFPRLCIGCVLGLSTADTSGAYLSTLTCSASHSQWYNKTHTLIQGYYNLILESFIFLVLKFQQHG